MAIDATTDGSKEAGMTSSSAQQAAEKTIMDTPDLPDADKSQQSQQQTDEESQDEGLKTPSMRSKLQSFLLMTSLCTAVFLAALDITIVTTALPTIADHFQSTSGYTWIGSAFLLAAAVVAPSWGKFSDIFGRKAILLIAVGVFFLGSTLCGAAISLEVLIVGRVIQGLGAGGLLSLVAIVIGDLFSPRERGKYYGIIGMVWAVAFTLGPLLGGAFTKNVSWRWCFYVNLPISGAAFVVIMLLLKLETPKTPIIAGLKAVDWIGSLTLVGGTLMFLLGLEFGGTVYPWSSPTVICLIVFGVFTVGVFWLVERNVAKYPIVPVHLYGTVSNSAILAINLLHGIVFCANIYFLPLYCQAVLGSSPLLSGVLLLPFAVAMSIGTVGTGFYLRKTGRYLDCIRLGFIILVLGAGLLYDLPPDKYWPKIILYQIVSGFGIGFNFQPPLIALQSNVPAQDNAAATSSFGLVRNVASAIGVVIGSVAFANKMNDQANTLTDALGGAPERARLFDGHNAQANVLLIAALESPQEQDAVRRAYWVSLRSIWIIAIAFSVGALLACFLIRHKKLESKHVEVKTGLAGEEERRRIAREHKEGKGEIVQEMVVVPPAA